MALVNGPVFSVVVATAERGALIEATLESVQRQTIGDLDVIVVSDGPAAPGLAAAVERFGERFRLVETGERCGSQFGPNNLGWSLAAGRYIAYLGHDDIWLPHHLAALLAALEQHPDAAFAASGCLYFGPPGSGPGHTWLTGMFDPHDRLMALTHFFPPSSVAHRRDLPDDVRWPDAAAVRRPVDSQFLLAAAQQGLGFTSTGQITVLKFNSALRYLSYLCPDDDEQRAALALLDDPAGLEERIGAAALEAATAGTYMVTCHPAERDREPGEPMRINAVLRGLETPPVQPLDGPAWVAVGDDPRGLDWHAREVDGEHAWRWSGPNPRPRLLIPYSHEGPVRISLQLATIATDDVRQSLTVLLDRHRVPATVENDPYGSIMVTFEGMLRSDRPSVVELRMNRTVPAAEFVPGTLDGRRLGVALTGFHLVPLA